MTTTTAAPVFKRTERGAGHSYTLNGQRIPGVTTVLRALAKPALINWAANTAANYAADNWAELSDVPPSVRIKRISGAHRQRNASAMTRGTRIHTFGAALLAGTQIDVPEELNGPVSAYARFLDSWRLEPIHTELPVCNTRYHYAGTLDAIAHSNRLGTVLFDIKTGSVYDEVALQLAAYRYADITPDPDIPVLEVDGAYVVHVLDDSVELLPVAAGQDTYAAFLHILAMWRWQDASAQDSLIGRAIFPEDI